MARARLPMHEIMRAERRVDCYAGETCDQHRPVWRAYCDGDRDSSDSAEDLVLDCKTLPAGAIVTVSIPVCPECGMDVENCQLTDDCGFDWKAWAEEQYA